LHDVLVEVAEPQDAQAAISPHREAEVFLARVESTTATFAVNLGRPRYLVGAASHEVAHLFSVVSRPPKSAYRESGRIDEPEGDTDGSDEDEEATNPTSQREEERAQAIEVGLGFGLLAVNHCLVETGLAQDRRGCLRERSFRLNRPGYLEWERVEELAAAHFVARGEDDAALARLIHSLAPELRASFRARVSRHARMRSTLLDAVKHVGPSIAKSSVPDGLG
jgi:hypothetical protein